MHRNRLSIERALGALAMGTVWFLTSAGSAVGQEARSGRSLYRAACAACHGIDGTGASPSAVAFAEEVPDFTECSFASREPDADWIAVTHDGGPVRGFSRMMPAFGDALTEEELARTMEHVRTFCEDDSWPRGELNLPRALFTEKAYPEDEAVLTTSTALEGAGAVVNELLYERRFGPTTQIEVAVPIGILERDSGGWVGGLGDVAVGVKRVLFHGLESGSIFSVVGELILPTGDEDDGFGKGTTVFEPFVAFGQILPSDAFFQFQGGLELPFDRDLATQEAFWRLTLGRSFTSGRWGRTWSPMVELLAKRELVSGEPVLYDLVPQMQVTLNTRQHVMLNVGLRLPLNESELRHAELLVYVLWDWFDGGFFDGW